MTNNKNIINFTVDQYYALCESLSSADDWKAWLNDSEFSSSNKTPVNHIPAMMRRRMSPLSKIAVQVALELIEQHDIGYIVFSSRHGELPRTVELIKSILVGDDASPMAFSQSVHNTAAGLTTIATKQAIPVTSLAAGQDTFQQALIESFTYLSEPELTKKKVLLVDFDAPLPNEYKEFESELFATYAVGLVISAGTAFNVTWQSNNNNQLTTKNDTLLPQSIECFKHLLTNSHSWNIYSKRILWGWHKSE
ncbi:beta-ketoacyl synthase chain length factor [Vibrio algarum]|uniref:Beta-ketoacyl synthase chain length factor n=1 Tax=Vibrio algarum TaxID=3020714 RepID=A0ABT4YNZ0_9VIBR|nr:beta-ketoacyl synthase chain length factor [Vibrio sp. KJ40-1]MDB1123266.1 beta-ketoacyl synthase chain length factor [Vibrio sp. KJ40-1]